MTSLRTLLLDAAALASIGLLAGASIFLCLAVGAPS